MGANIGIVHGWGMKEKEKREREKKENRMLRCLDEETKSDGSCQEVLI